MTPDCSTDRILRRARACGAELAGLTGVGDVGVSPSAEEAPPMRWPTGARSVLVLGLPHPASDPELDWWGGPGATPGNRVLQKVSATLKRWLEGSLQVATWILPYHVERGGIFLKDAAVLAGLGAMGVNNLVITPQWGPRVRWRALLLDLEPPEPTDATPAFDPCAGCARPCVTACPQQALAGGRYNLHLCSRQMQLDEAAAGPGDGGSGSDALPVKYCRACELVCPVGSAGLNRQTLNKNM